MKKQTWRQWARVCAKDPNSPSKLRKGSLAPLTSQDMRALDAIVACWELYACSDLDGRHSALAAARVLIRGMQPETRWIARELIPFSLDWGDRERLWPQVAIIEVEGTVDAETGAGVDALARRLTEKLGRAGQRPPKAQAEFDTRERS